MPGPTRDTPRRSIDRCRRNEQRDISRIMRKGAQLALPLPVRGGRRRGAGRKPKEEPDRAVTAIRYVLGNAAHHFGTEGDDPFSSVALGAADRRLRT